MTRTSDNEDTGPPAPAPVVPLRALREHVGTITKRVHDTGEPVVISSHGKPLAAIVPIPQRPDTTTAAAGFADAPPPPLRLRRPDPDDDPPPAAAA